MLATSLKILVVEDHEPDAILIERRLSRCTRISAEIDIANWMNTAVLAIQNRPYDIVLLDLSLPDSHGIDTVYGIRKADPNVPVLILSAHEDVDLAVLAIKAGAQGYLLKDIDLSSDRLEREILYTLERFRNEILSKDLLRASLQTVVSDDSPPRAGVLLVSEHLSRMEAAYLEVRDMLAHSSPSLAAEVQEINAKHGVPAVFQEARSVLQLDTGSMQKLTKRSDRHLRVLRDVARVPISPEDAERTLMRIIAWEDSDD